MSARNDEPLPPGFFVTLRVRRERARQAAIAASGAPSGGVRRPDGSCARHPDGCPALDPEARERAKDAFERTIWLRLRDSNGWRRVAALLASAGGERWLTTMPPAGILRSVVVWHAQVDRKRRLLRAHSLLGEWDRAALCAVEDAWLGAQREATLSLWQVHEEVHGPVHGELRGEVRGAALVDAVSGERREVETPFAFPAGTLVLARVVSFRGRHLVEPSDADPRPLAGRAADAAREALGRKHPDGRAAGLLAAWSAGRKTLV